MPENFWLFAAAVAFLVFAIWAVTKLTGGQVGKSSATRDVRGAINDLDEKENGNRENGNGRDQR